MIAVDRAEDDPRLPYALGTAGELLGLRGERVQPVAADACDAELLAEAVDDSEAAGAGSTSIVAAAGVIAGGVPRVGARRSSRSRRCSTSTSAAC